VKERKLWGKVPSKLAHLWQGRAARPTKFDILLARHQDHAEIELDRWLRCPSSETFDVYLLQSCLGIKAEGLRPFFDLPGNLDLTL
jgi:hypothetical protein